ncbi:hypothetical protein JGH11_07650 [Dysgonomonas sp. Marseille-P4677]|nr:hypothetical protein [Dysgonomonas sp. Marseille-P4677]
MVNGEVYHPGFSLDCVIIGYHKNKILILLKKFLNKVWNLPGGFMLAEEKNADEAVKKILRSSIGSDVAFYKQFYLFSDIDREDIDLKKEHMRNTDHEGKEFYQQRFLTLGYYAFVRYEDIELPSNYKWFDWEELPPLYSDHKSIIERAIKLIRVIDEYIPIGYGMLPKKFTMTELRNIHEALHGTILDRRNFQRKVLSTGAVVKLDECKNVKTYPKPILFQYNLDKFNKLVPFL